jgi:CxxC motif-containing protein
MTNAPQTFAPSSPVAPVKAKKPFFKRKLVWLLLVVAIIAIAAPKGSGSSSTATTGNSTPAASGSAAAAAAVGTPVRDGDFEFVVQSVETGVAQIGTDMLNTKAQGAFVIVSVKVTNIGSEPGTFFGSNAKLHDTQGREFEPSSGAAIYLEDSNSLIEPINPGNTVTGKIIYDVAAGTALDTIELHDSAFSDGVTVKLS